MVATLAASSFFENTLVVFIGTLLSAIIGPILALYVGFAFAKKKASKWYDVLVHEINRDSIKRTFEWLEEEGLSDEFAMLVKKVQNKVNEIPQEAKKDKTAKKKVV